MCLLITGISAYYLLALLHVPNRSISSGGRGNNYYIASKSRRMLRTM
jgi:hypothetical protein